MFSMVLNGCELRDVSLITIIVKHISGVPITIIPTSDMLLMEKQRQQQWQQQQQPIGSSMGIDFGATLQHRGGSSSAQGPFQRLLVNSVPSLGILRLCVFMLVFMSTHITCFIAILNPIVTHQ